MNLYMRRSSQPLKWVVALLVFIVAMCFTMTDVYGNPPDGRIGGGNADQPTDGANGPNGSLATDDNPDATTAVPEPATLVLLAGGLGALYAARRLRKEK